MIVHLIFPALGVHQTKSLVTMLNGSSLMQVQKIPVLGLSAAEILIGDFGQDTHFKITLINKVVGIILAVLIKNIYT